MIREAVKFIANSIISEKNYLSLLDTKIGDGDHGLNMARGSAAAIDSIDDLSDLDASDISIVLKTVGQAFIMNVGGAAGPLYGTGFVEASKVLSADDRLNPAALEKFFDAAISGIKRRGHAKKADKTMLDVLIPVHDFISQNMDLPTDKLLDLSLAVAREGVDFTKTIAAKRGRASYIGDRSIGFEDPGAVSSMLILRAFVQFTKDNHLFNSL